MSADIESFMNGVIPISASQQFFFYRKSKSRFFIEIEKKRSSYLFPKRLILFIWT